ncbi:MAG: hypothetical protein ACTSQE_17055 [Candidatus Heimdallarchaeaceae archaeon]
MNDGKMNPNYKILKLGENHIQWIHHKNNTWMEFLIGEDNLYHVEIQINWKPFEKRRFKTRAEAMKYIADMQEE